MTVDLQIIPFCKILQYDENGFANRVRPYSQLENYGWEGLRFITAGHLNFLFYSAGNSFFLAQTALSTQNTLLQNLREDHEGLADTIATQQLTINSQDTRITSLENLLNNALTRITYLENNNAN